MIEKERSEKNDGRRGKSGCVVCCGVVFFFNDTATTEIYTLSLHDALPIWGALSTVLDTCCQKVAQYLPARFVRVWQYDPNTQIGRAHV